MSSRLFQKPKKPGLVNYGPQSRKAQRTSLVQLALTLMRKSSKFPVVEPTGIPGPRHSNLICSSDSHSANNIEVTRTIPEILQPVPGLYFR